MRARARDKRRHFPGFCTRAGGRWARAGLGTKLLRAAASGRGAEVKVIVRCFASNRYEKML